MKSWKGRNDDISEISRVINRIIKKLTIPTKKYNPTYSELTNKLNVFDFFNHTLAINKQGFQDFGDFYKEIRKHQNNFAIEELNYKVMNKVVNAIKTGNRLENLTGIPAIEETAQLLKYSPKLKVM